MKLAVMLAEKNPIFPYLILLPFRAWQISLNKTPWCLKEGSRVIRHVVWYSAFCWSIWCWLCLEMRWDAPVHHPEHCPAQDCRSMRLTQPGAQSWSVSHGRNSLPAHGRQGEILLVLGNQLSLAPSVIPWQDTLPAVLSSFRQGQSMTCPREGWRGCPFLILRGSTLTDMNYLKISCEYMENFRYSC